MGREIKRVSVEFDWPLNIIWKGYLNPYNSTECTLCGGGGLNPATKKLSDNWYTHLRTDGKEGWMYHLEEADVQVLLDAGRLMDFTRVAINEEQKEIVKEKIAKGENNWLPFDNGCIPSPEEVNIWAKKGFGHDSVNQWICVKAKAKRLGVYGECPHCKGKGYYYCEEKYEDLSEAWEPIEPPEGEGYQLWETTSEGSPTSPVFKTPEELAKWLFDNAASAFAGQTCSYEQWLNFIRGPGWAPSAIFDGNRVRSGVECTGGSPKG